MTPQRFSFLTTLPRDLIAGTVVFLVALPLCLGIALASHAPLFSGLLSGMVGGILVGFLSGSRTSVSGPAAGLTAVIATQIDQLQTFEAFLMAVVLAGIIQIIFSINRLGYIAIFFPPSVTQGLLAAIGMLLLFKQIPYLLGFEANAGVHIGSALVGISAVCLLIAWEKIPTLRKMPIPAPIIAVLFGVLAQLILPKLQSDWALPSPHLVQVPVAISFKDFLGFFIFPDFKAANQLTVYLSGLTIAVVASLETLLNLEAIDKVDPLKRPNSPNRELLAQGVGNIVSGLLGGLPMTSVVVRSSVNIQAGNQTKLSTIWHGCLIVSSVLLFPTWLNRIPLSALAAILFITGLKLTRLQLWVQMWKAGKDHFFIFATTSFAIVLTDLLTGVLLGLSISGCFTLFSRLQKALKLESRTHL